MNQLRGHCSGKELWKSACLAILKTAGINISEALLGTEGVLGKGGGAGALPHMCEDPRSNPHIQVETGHRILCGSNPSAPAGGGTPGHLLVS